MRNGDRTEPTKFICNLFRRTTHNYEILKGTTNEKYRKCRINDDKLAFSILLPGCAGYYPQTREEAIAHPGTKQWSFTVPRKLDDVVASVNKQAEACVNETHSQGMGTRSIQRSVQIMTIKKVSASKAELDYRQLSNTAVAQPEGGIFMFNANFESQGPKSTVVTFYNGNGPLRKAMQEWVKGNDNACHGYGGRNRA